VTEDGSKDVTIYLPSDQFYDFHTLKPISGNGSYLTLTNISYTEIPVHIRGGAIIPLRVSGANTTAALRKLDFELLVALDKERNAKGELYLDDGESLVQKATSEIEFWYDGKTKVLEMNGTFGYDAGVKIGNVTILGGRGPVSCLLNRKLTRGFTIDIKGLKCVSI
jgi:alpha-glucosidase